MYSHPALQADNVFKSFVVEKQTIDVLKGLSLSIPQGAFHAVMGPSGAGKSTLMNLLAGLLPVDSGVISIDNCPLTGRSDNALTLLRRREVGIIFQDYNLIPTLTVEENIALPVLLDNKTVPRDHLDHLISLVGLTHRRNQPADCLSGGEAQRTAIARAFVANPKIILADEPTGNLDAPAAKDFCQTLRTMNQNLGIAILLISHDAQVAAIADTVHVLRDGKIVGSFETQHDATHVATRYLEFMTR
jgi:putative ABC transport system ATP-binding protein